MRVVAACAPRRVCVFGPRPTPPRRRCRRRRGPPDPAVRASTWHRTATRTAGRVTLSPLSLAQPRPTWPNLAQPGPTSPQSGRDCDTALCRSASEQLVLPLVTRDPHPPRRAKGRPGGPDRQRALPHAGALMDCRGADLQTIFSFHDRCYLSTIIIVMICSKCSCSPWFSRPRRHCQNSRPPSTECRPCASIWRSTFRDFSGILLLMRCLN